MSEIQFARGKQANQSSNLIVDGKVSFTTDNRILYIDYLENGEVKREPVQSLTVNGHTIDCDVPSNAKFTDTTYSPAGSGLGLVKSGGDVTIADGTITVNDDSHNHVITNVDGLQAALDGKSDSDHTHTVDSSLSSSSTNPVQNKVINSALSGKVPTTRTVNGKALSANITLSASDVGADAEGSADAALTEAKSYTDTKVSALVNGAPETLDTLGELADAMEENDDAIAALESIAVSKANASDLTSHTGNTTVHITSTERTNWNAAKTHADSAHAPSNAEVNQNAFSNVLIGSTTIVADTKTDTLTLAGSNVTLTPDATNDKVTIGITKENVITALGYTPPETDTTYELSDFSITASAAEINKLDGLTATTAELNYINGVTSNIQTQLNDKASNIHNHNGVYPRYITTDSEPSGQSIGDHWLETY